MATITTRVQGDSPKGSPLTNAEVDNNFINLNTAKYESGDNVSFGTGAFSGGVPTGGAVVDHIQVGSTSGSGLKISTTSVFESDDIVFFDAPATQTGQLVFQTEGASRLNISSTEVYFNHASTDTDFRVASDGNTHALFVDAGNSRVGINTNNPGTGLEVRYANTERLSSANNYWPSGSIRMQDNNAYDVADAGPGLSFYRLRDVNSGQVVLGYIGARGVYGTNSSYRLDFSVQTGAAANILPTSPQMTLTGSGNLGINDSAPSNTLTSGVSTSKVLSIASGGNTAISIRATDAVNDRNAVLEMLSSGNGASNSIIVYGDTDTTPTTKSGLQFHGYHNGSRAVRAELDWSGQWITQMGAIFNESSADSDFRVESDGSTHALFVDAGNSRVGINESTPVATLSVQGDILRRIYQGMTSNTVIGTADATANWYQIANQGDVYIQAMSSTGSGAYQQSGGNIYIKAGTPYSNNTSGGYVTLQSRANAVVGSTRPHVLIKHESTSVAEFDDQEAVFNEGSQDLDFRVETDAHAHAFFVDASSSKIGMWNSAPTYGLDVLNTGRFQNTLYLGNSSTGAGDLQIFDTGNNSLQLAGIGSNSFRFDMVGTSAVGNLTFQDLTMNIRAGVGSSTTPLIIGVNDTYRKSIHFQESPDSYGLGVYGCEVGYDAGTNNFFIAVNENGTNRESLCVFRETGAVTVNEFSNDAVDFRVESDSETHALFVDASGNTVQMFGSGVLSDATVGHDFRSNGQATFVCTSTARCLQINNISTTDAQKGILFQRSNAEKGSVVIGSSGVTYNTTSDRRLKDNIEPITDGTAKLLAMNPVTHTWKDVPDAPAVHGFIAQEMIGIIPEAVSGDPTGQDMMAMDYGRITPVLVAALQDAHKKIAELEARLNTLEGK